MTKNQLILTEKQKPSLVKKTKYQRICILENETEKLLITITGICATLVEQTHTKPQGTMEFQLTQPNETFSFTPPIILSEKPKMERVQKNPAGN